jgi:hypothetical protein
MLFETTDAKERSMPEKLPWYVLVHQIPPQPSSLRVKTWRRLKKIGAVPLKQSVYVLPRSERAYEDLLWTAKAVTGDGGEAVIFEAALLEGTTDGEVRALFQAAREEEYTLLLRELRDLEREAAEHGGAAEESARLRAQLERFRRKAEEIGQIDFFDAPGRGAVEAVMAEIELLLTAGRRGAGKQAVNAPSNRTWVTRQGVYVDRIACAWLIRRFVDPSARFRFVAPGDAVAPEEIRFDMAEAELTHRGDRCTFEVMVEDFGLLGLHPGLGPVAEIIHDIDLKEDTYNRPEGVGLAALFSGLASASSDDETRIARGSVVMDGIFESFRNRCR